MLEERHIEVRSGVGQTVRKLAVLASRVKKKIGDNSNVAIDGGHGRFVLARAVGKVQKAGDVRFCGHEDGNLSTGTEVINHKSEVVVVEQYEQVEMCKPKSAAGRQLRRVLGKPPSELDATFFQIGGVSVCGAVRQMAVGMRDSMRLQKEAFDSVQAEERAGACQLHTRRPKTRREGSSQVSKAATCKRKPAAAHTAAVRVAGFLHAHTEVAPGN